MDDFKIAFIYSHFVAYHVKNETELGGWPQSGQGAIFFVCFAVKMISISLKTVI